MYIQWVEGFENRQKIPTQHTKYKITYQLQEFFIKVKNNNVYYFTTHTRILFESKKTSIKYNSSIKIKYKITQQ